MSLFSKLEQRIRNSIEGVFRQSLKGEIQPVELANALVTEMVNHRRVSVTRTYVPNSFTVRLNPSDFERISPLRKTIQSDLISHLQTRAKQEGWSFVDDPNVLIEPGEVEAGKLEVESAFVEPEEGLDTSSATSTYSIEQQMPSGCFEVEKTRVYPTAANGATSAEVAILSGPGKGARYRLTPPCTIGRASECDISLEDRNVSRRHLRIDRRGRRWFLEDLGSTNGTYLNGRSIRSSDLKTGDEIRIGTTILKFTGD